MTPICSGAEVSHMSERVDDPSPLKNASRDDSPHRRHRAPSPGRSKTGYFVYLLVGVHQSYAEAKRAYARLDFAKSLPVTYERNENGMGKCKTWLAVTRPFERRAFAEVAQRQLALYAGEGAVRVGRGVK